MDASSVLRFDNCQNQQRRTEVPARNAWQAVLSCTTPTLGHLNILVSWWLIGLGMASGAVLGLWSFGEPVAPPAGFAAYDDLPRRLARLAHIAAVALPLINLHYVPWMECSAWNPRVRRLGCRLLLFGTVSLPVALMAAALWRPALYATPAPVLALIAAVFLLAARPGACTTIPER